jgi:hypothetical protein
VATEDILNALLDELLVNVDDYVAQPYWAARDYLISVRAGQLPFDAQLFANDIAPLVEVALSWQQLANDGAQVRFLNHCKTRVHHSTDFRGTVFELLTASRVVLSGAKWGWAEDSKLIGNHQGGVVDFWVTESSGTVAVECTTRHPDVMLELKHVQQAVYDKAQNKFTDLSYLPQPVARSVIFYELTRSGFVKPPVEEIIDGLILPNSVGAICLTWRELFDVDGGYSLHPHFQWLGEPVAVCALAVEVRSHGQIFVRKYVEPEPTFGIWGPEEKIGED